MSEEFFKLKTEVKELICLKNKVFELEITNENDQEILKEQLNVIKALEEKVESLEKKRK
jgi:hypothetical protein